MANTHTLLGFHAVKIRLKTDPAAVKEILLEQTRRDGRMMDLVAQAKTAGITPQWVDSARLASITKGAQHQGVVAFINADAAQAPLDLDDVLADTPPQALLLLLDGVTDPRNLGACLRVADAVGALAVIAPKDRSASLTDIASKTSAGASETVPYVLVTNLARAIEQIQAAGFTVWGTSDQADLNLFQANLTGRTALVLGAEGQGLRRLTRDKCDGLISIPMRGAVESLNVSVATGVVLFEALRQQSQ